MEIRCPDCGQNVLQKNLQRHYRRLHPGLDPRRRQRETKGHRDMRRSHGDVRSGLGVVVFGAFAVTAIVVLAAILVWDWAHPGSDDPETRDFFFAASDGAVINGTFYPSGTPGAYTIYLLHDLGEDRHVWDDYAEYLQLKGGYNVVAVDLRGHGTSIHNVKTPDITYDHRTMTDEDFLDMKYDLVGLQKWITGTTEGRKNTDAGSEGAVVAVGTLGAVIFNQAARMAAQWGIDSGVYVDPVRGAYGIETVQASEDWGDVRPLMLLSSDGDSEVMLALQKIAENRPENAHVLTIEGNDRGAELFKYDPVRDLAMTTFADGFRIVDA
jgi:pimeloyl-ACP methyl ester carboxylesterase